MHILRRMSKHLKAISLGSMALAAVGAIGWGVWHFRESRTMKTDDCRVEASIVSVGSKLAERVTSVDVEEGETVRRGQTLAHLDSRTMQARLMAARSRVKLMQARHDEMLAGFRPQEIESQRARTAQASASLEHARRDYERVEKLVREQAGISSADRVAVRATTWRRRRWRRRSRRIWPSSWKVTARRKKDPPRPSWKPHGRNWRSWKCCAGNAWLNPPWTAWWPASW